MKKVYLDNAATTPMFTEVIDSMVDTMYTSFGNPSSTHAFGRSAKTVIETARKNMAQFLCCHSSELVFTSGGTEANNLILKNAVYHLGIKHIITSKLEHHAVLHTVAFLEKTGAKVSYVKILPNGTIDYNDLESLLKKNNNKTLISLMHVNNEIGTILNVEKVIALKKQYNALFHSDTVQSVGHFNLSLSKLNVDFITSAAHKFHGPKGIGFAFFRKGTGIFPEILGGEQERGSRAGTENTAAIVGMEKALCICVKNIHAHVKKLKALKTYCIAELKTQIPSIKFNSVCSDLTQSTHTVLNIQCNRDFPMLLFQLDLKGIAVSGGSACQSGSNQGSHVLKSFLSAQEQLNTSIRISFSTMTTKAEIDDLIAELKKIID